MTSPEPAATEAPDAFSPASAAASGSPVAAVVGPELSSAATEVTDRISAGYASLAPSVTLGSVVCGAEVNPAAQVKIPLSMFTRHGLVAGATGTGKTKTLQLMAEQLSAAGVAVLMPDVKGDLSGLAQPGIPGDRISTRAADTGDTWQPSAYPVEFVSLAGQGNSIQLRATIDSFGPILLSKVLDLNATQESTLGLIFHWADQKAFPLLDTKDLRAVISHLTSAEGKADLTELGGVSKSTAGVILRAVTNLEADGGDVFFGEPQWEVQDFLRSVDGRGVISLLDASGLQSRPAMFSTFMMWLLSELFEVLPEVGDLEKPKLVFMFDEAHLLFADASKALLSAIAQTVKLIRSKGVGVFFCTQLPTDVPGPVLSQLGARVQHALRAFTPQDQEALAATVKTYPVTSDYELSSALTSLGTGEAIVTVLSEKGAPTPVAWTRVRAPRSLMAPASPEVVAGLVAQSPLAGKYQVVVDRESAYEMLTGRLAAPANEVAPGAAAGGGSVPVQPPSARVDWPTLPPLPDPIWPDQPSGQASTAPSYEPDPQSADAGGGFLSDLTNSPVLKSFWRSLGTSLGGSLGRTIGGTRSKRRR
ncbi:DUF853 family protein [Nakamurella antarctica]|uniref:DUF853 family protein n=1 Tax=Nakamurella antarctica TaxID=1902245 RepID=A0A3G8ZM61_9ACTN|nr:helicase HerA-like domain-containing protein [Nakamurella antarctica]AZI58320.1 DUF853 family protein [Nakamurella antarctica]